MNFVDILKQPNDMDDSELSGEYGAVNSVEFDELINDERISFETKQKLLSHKEKVIQEKFSRDNGEWIIPLYEFGLFDF